MRARMEGIVASKRKVVVVMGATATGKSKLAVDLALCLGGEVVNSDKIQVHDGFDLSHQHSNILKHIIFLYYCQTYCHDKKVV
jgi:nicotinamide riboside kinase